MADEKFLGLRTVIYKVPDLDEAKSWYKLVLDKSPYFDESYYVGFDVGGYELGLLPVESSDEHTGTNIMVYWGVEDISKTYDRLLELGAKANDKPEDVGEGIMVGTVKDPWGNVLGIIYNPHFKM